MKKLLKDVLITTAALFSIMEASPQFSQEPAAIASPNAATLGEFGEIPVSLFTGMPEISIPIYTVECNGLDMPITLDYHASGIRPDQHPNWTGIGWSLNVGGIITRVVNDCADDESKDYITEQEKYGYYYRHIALENTEWSDRDFVRFLAQKDSQSDTEPDKFSFSFLGYSGNFYLDSSGEWKVQSSSALKVEMLGFNIVPMRNNDKQRDIKTFGGFSIITDDGTKFIFGKENPSETERDETCPIDYSIDIFRQSYDKWTATSWYLSKIILPNGDEVKFTYERVNYICQMYRYTYNIIKARAEYEGIFHSGLESSGFGVRWPSLKDSYYGKLISPVYLHDIQFPNGDIVYLWRTKPSGSTEELKYPAKAFDKSYDEEAEHYMFYQNSTDNFTINDCIDSLKWQSLGAVCVTSKSGGSYIYQFTYTKDYNQRLTLTELRKTAAYAPICSYKFEYYQPEKMPKYFEEETDHWGYCNGMPVTDYGTDLGNYHKRREPNAEKMKYGILTKIIYPTGGYARLEYEPHTYCKVVDKSRQALESLAEEKIAGGLRIKRIYGSKTGNSSDEQMMKEYHYVKNFATGGTETSGILGGKIQYLFEDYPVYSYSHNDALITLSVFSSQSILPMSDNSVRSHIGYSEVAEKYANGAYKVYKYTNFDNGIFDEPHLSIIQASETDYEPYSSRAMERGLLSSIEEYDSSGNIRSRQTISYEPDSDKSSTFAPSVKASFSSITDSYVSVLYDEGVAYKFPTYSMRKKSKTEETYEPGSPVPFRVTETYEYNDYKQVRKIRREAGNGEAVIKEYTYPTDYANYMDYHQMVLEHVISPIVEYKETFDAGNGAYRQRYEKYDYKKYGSTYRPQKCTVAVRGAAELRKEYEYDKSGRLIAVTEDGAETTVYVWGYNGQHIIAEIKGVTLYEVETFVGDFDEFASSETPDFAVIEKIRQTYPGCVTSYTYSPFYGMTSKTDSRGSSEYYRYDTFGRLLYTVDNDGNVIKVFDYGYKNR